MTRPNNLKDFKIVENFLALAKMRELYEDCSNLFDLLAKEEEIIKHTTGKLSDTEIRENLSHIKHFEIKLRGKKNKDFKALQGAFTEAGPAIARLLGENIDEYNDYLKEKIIDEIKLRFKHYIEVDSELDNKEKESLFHEGKEMGLSVAETANLINEWLKEFGAKEVEHHSGSSSAASTEEEFYDFGNRTFYEILGVPEDADSTEIEEAFKKEQKQYINTKGKNKIGTSARFVLIAEAYKCLKDPNKRRNYDRKQKEPKTYAGDGKPILEVAPDNPAGYIYKDVRRGAILEEKIIIKNIGGGLQQGTIKSNTAWIEPERNKLTEQHEQDLTICIDASKIPRSEIQVEGAITIDTNGGRKIIPVKVVMETLKIEAQSFKEIYPFLAAALGGFLFSFVNGAELANLGYLATLFFVPIKMYQEGRSTTGQIIGYTIAAFFVCSIIFSFLEWIGKFSPHFISFVIGAYIAGGITNLGSTLIVKQLRNNGFSLGKIPPALIYSVSAGLLILTLTIHSAPEKKAVQLAEKTTTSKPPKKYNVPAPKQKIPTLKEQQSKGLARYAPPVKSVEIIDAFAGEGWDNSRKEPIGRRTYFTSGRQKIFYFIFYKNSGGTKSHLTYKLYKNSNHLKDTTITINQGINRGYAWSWLESDYQPGSYEMKIFEGNDFITSFNFNVKSPDNKPIISEDTSPEPKEYPQVKEKQLKSEVNKIKQEQKVAPVGNKASVEDMVHTSTVNAKRALGINIDSQGTAPSIQKDIIKPMSGRDTKYKPKSSPQIEKNKVPSGEKDAIIISKEDIDMFAPPTDNF